MMAEALSPNVNTSSSGGGGAQNAAGLAARWR